MLPIRRRLYQSQPGFTPRQLFSALQGAWLELVVGNIWQENTGVTPTTTGGQTIGLLLDQSQGSVLGPELVSNGTFDTDSTGWAQSRGGALSVVSGALRVTGAGGTQIGAATTVSATVGRLYRFACSYNAGTSSTGILLRAASDALLGTFSLSTTYASGSGTFVGYFFATAATMYVGCLSIDTVAGRYIEIDNVSVREIAGNHAAQAVSGSRPTYQLDSNNLPLARHDATDSLVVSLPNLGGGIYSASGSVYFSTPIGMSALHGQSMGLTYTLPALSTDIYSWIVVPQRLNTVLEGRLERYMLRKAGLAAPDYLTDDSGSILTDDIGDPLLAG